MLVMLNTGFAAGVVIMAWAMFSSRAWKAGLSRVSQWFRTGLPPACLVGQSLLTWWTLV
ncbi:MAG: hypothetical protein ACRDXX_05190 [Stackebrandtia sp.]